MDPIMIFQRVSICITLIVLIFPNLVHSHGNGAPSNRCDSMEPGHWIASQETIPPYQVILDKTVITPGDRVNITLRTVRGHTGFKGFFVMVKMGDDEEGTEVQQQDPEPVYGEFDIMESDMKNAQPVDCFKRKNSAMTHLTNDVKSSVELSWIAPALITENRRSHSPSYTEKELKVVATFVKDFWTVWTNVEPVGEVRVLLTDTHLLSPKFQQIQTNSGSTPSTPQFRGGHIGNPSEGEALNTANLPLDDSSSFTHFKRIWNYMVGIFNNAS